MSNVMTYVLGNKNIPEWVNTEAATGRIKVNYNDEMEMESAKVTSGMKTYTANVGDTIMKTKSGLVVIPKEKTEKYMQTVKPVFKKIAKENVEEKKEEKEEE